MWKKKGDKMWLSLMNIIPFAENSRDVNLNCVVIVLGAFYQLEGFPYYYWLHNGFCHDSFLILPIILYIYGNGNMIFSSLFHL